MRTDFSGLTVPAELVAQNEAGGQTTGGQELPVRTAGQANVLVDHSELLAGA